MKSSRAMLLSAMLFAVPAVASHTLDGIKQDAHDVKAVFQNKADHVAEATKAKAQQLADTTKAKAEEARLQAATNQKVQERLDRLNEKAAVKKARARDAAAAKIASRKASNDITDAEINAIEVQLNNEIAAIDSELHLKATKTKANKETAKLEVQARSFFQKTADLALAPFVFVLATAPDRIAQETLGRLATVDCLNGTAAGRFLADKYVGRIAVLSAAAVAAYKAYNAINAQDDSNDDDSDIFGA